MICNGELGKGTENQIFSFSELRNYFFWRVRTRIGKMCLCTIGWIHSGYDGTDPLKRDRPGRVRITRDLSTDLSDRISPKLFARSSSDFSGSLIAPHVREPQPSSSLP